MIKREDNVVDKVIKKSAESCWFYRGLLRWRWKAEKISWDAGDQHERGISVVKGSVSTKTQKLKKLKK
jgi:hypothetical protein